METVAVYNYEKFGITQGKIINHGTFATMEFIKSNNLTPLPHTKKDVPLSAVDGNGQYVEKTKDR